MQAIILAAGCGSRLNSNDHVDIPPKCLVDLHGHTLLQHQIIELHRAGIYQICIVVGYGAKKVMEVAGSCASLIFNDCWAETNSLYSLCLCHDWVTEPVIVMNCDVLAHREVFHRVVTSPGNAFAFDSTSGMDSEHMKVELEEGRLKAMSKQLPIHRTMGENVGMFRFEINALEYLFKEGKALIQSGGRKMWMAAAVERIAQYVPIRGIDIAGLPWIEIDFPSDLRAAQEEIWPKICNVPTLP